MLAVDVVLWFPEARLPHYGPLLTHLDLICFEGVVCCVLIKARRVFFLLALF